VLRDVRILLFSIVMTVGAWTAAKAADPPAASDAYFRDHLQPLVTKYCIECHGPATAEGELRLDRQPWQPADEENREVWASVLGRLESGEMPPADAKAKPTEAELTAIRRSLRGELAAAEAEQRRREGRARIRRLNRVEYQYTLHDLLAIDLELKDLLPEDPVASGFDNVDQALRISAVQMERYLAAAEAALDAAIVKGPRPETKTRRLIYKEIDGMRKRIDNGSSVTETPDAAVLFHAGYTPYEPRELWGTPPGRYRIRISAYGYQTGGQPAVMGVYFGNFIPNVGQSHLVGYFDVAADRPTVVEFEDRFVSRNDSVKPVPYGTGDPWRNDGTIHSHKGPGLAVQWIEVEGPLVDSWPPESYRRLFGELDLAQAGQADIRPLLAKFLPRAFRRRLTDEELAHYVGLASERLAAGQSFEKALRFACTAALCSPNFLFLGANEPERAADRTAPADDFLLATRLSYFLWSSLPDDELFRLAARAELRKPDVLRAQTERLLADPKARRFTENFTGQWLGLRNIDFTTPDRQLYPEFDEFLQVSMVGETHRFFEEVLKNDLSLLSFVDSDWAMLNRRLAEHYGISGVTSAAFERVTLPAGSHRGGVLTQASVLKITANGTNTSPVVRGAWVLDKIMGVPASPPPAGVPAVEPDIRGATTIREQLASHRTTAQCASCHRQIDPPGFALENFDVIGGWRERYRIVPERGARVQRETVTTSRGPRPVVYGPAVDAADTLEGRGAFAGIDDFKKLLLADPEPIARGLAEKLLIYATGHPVELADRPALDQIVAGARARNYGFRSLVHELVQHEVFRSK
jgi:mono/diheme cytochrome c family protein